MNIGPSVRMAAAPFASPFAALSPAIASARAGAGIIVPRTAEVEGMRLHYLTAGHGPAVILLHGYTQTSRMWRPIIPLLAERFTAIAPDLPGIGDSEIPKNGLDMKTASIRVHALAKSLDVEKARVVGHDIGLMVAYAYAAQFPAEVEKLVVMDAFLPGIAGWEVAYNDPRMWHFRFNGSTPEALVRGREKTYFQFFWNDLAADKTRSVPTADRKAYIAAYSRPGRMRAGWAYFAAWPQTAKDFAQMAQTKLTMPALSIAGEEASARVLGPQMKLVASEVTDVVLKDTGHWVLEERPKDTTGAIEVLVTAGGSHMRYRLLGNSGLRVSEAALGTMTFGDDWGWGAAKDEARKVYDAFRGAGGNFIDTANVYTNGTSESYLGEFIQGHRQAVVMATKYTNSMPGTDPNAAGNHRKSMMQAVEASLRRLRTDYIDLYWVHIWDQITPVEEVMRGLDDLVRQGKVLYVGISDAPAWWIAQANTLARLRGWSPFVGLQIEYSLIERTVERELIPAAKALNVGVTAWSPLANGVLTGKYHGHGSSEPGRMSSDMLKEFMPEKHRTDRVVAAVKALSDETGRSMAQVALAWLRYRPVPVIPIIGARKLAQLQDNLASFDLTLSAEQLKALDEASRIELGFPYDLYAKEMVRAIGYGGLRDRILA